MTCVVVRAQADQIKQIVLLRAQKLVGRLAERRMKLQLTVRGLACLPAGRWAQAGGRSKGRSGWLCRADWGSGSGRDWRGVRGSGLIAHGLQTSRVVGRARKSPSQTPCARSRRQPSDPASQPPMPNHQPTRHLPALAPSRSCLRSPPLSSWPPRATTPPTGHAPSSARCSGRCRRCWRRWAAGQAGGRAGLWEGGPAVCPLPHCTVGLLAGWPARWLVLHAGMPCHARVQRLPSPPAPRLSRRATHAQRTAHTCGAPHASRALRYKLPAHPTRTAPHARPPPHPMRRPAPPRPVHSTPPLPTTIRPCCATSLWRETRSWCLSGPRHPRPKPASRPRPTRRARALCCPAGRRPRPRPPRPLCASRTTRTLPLLLRRRQLPRMEEAPSCLRAAPSRRPWPTEGTTTTTATPTAARGRPRLRRRRLRQTGTARPLQGRGSRR